MTIPSWDERAIRWASPSDEHGDGELVGPGETLGPTSA